MDTINDSKVIRAPSLKRGKNDERLCDRIKLKKVLGLTVCSNAALDVSPTNGVLAYPAGCTIVLFHTKKLNQSYLLNTSRKAITAVTYSQCGRYIATGECGINPAIKVWELDTQSNINESNAGGTIIAEFLGHKYAVCCVAFSPNGKYLVSVGSQHDMIVNVYDWKLNLKIASNKVSAKVTAVSFSEDGSYFVTVGNRHVKYWYLEGNRKYKEPVPLMGRSAILGELRNNDFCAVACGKGETSESTYAITRVGHLVEFNSRRLLDKWVACRTTSANCICVTTNYILVGCAEAIVRIFNAATLEYVTTLPRTHYLGVDVAQGVHINHIMSVPPNARYPDTIAMVYDEVRSKVHCVYNDHSLYIWDLRDVRRVGKSQSFLHHSACIWGVETVPYCIESPNSQTLPTEAFLTCSSDDTIRVWGLDGCENTEIYRKNIYSKNCLKVFYIDDELNFIKDVDNPILNTEKMSSYDGRNGVRCIKVNPDKTHLATGDRSGNIRIYNLSSLKLMKTIEAHDSEVLCLEYTNEKIERKLLASASRDRLIHVFDVENTYKILQTLDDHSSSITSVKFIGSALNFQMISCGADKSIMFRNFQNNQFLRGTNCSGKTTLYDMEIDSNSKHILTACQDRNIRVYGTQNAKHTKTFKGSHSEDGSLIKLSLDPSGIYIATSCTDKTLSVYDYYSNECMARMYGHSELVTGLKFTNDCKYLISASGDGCIFIWQIPHDMTVTMQARLSQQRLRSGYTNVVRPVMSTTTEIFVDSTTAREPEKLPTSPTTLFVDNPPLTPGYKFSEVGQLPQWAKRKGSEDVQSNPAVLSSSPNQNQIISNPKPRGRWAQRGQMDSDPLDLRNISGSPLSNNYNNLINNNVQTSDYNSSSSKDIYNQAYLSEDSSIDSGMENRKDITFRNRIISEHKESSSHRFESYTEHDGDIEDISDGERTSSDHGMMFYPTVTPGTPTDFKVNAMDENELRKSIKKKSTEKFALSLAKASTASGTGTGTSDTEDEGSTPSGENADRSLVSTLGGSSESIPQQASSSFLQSALDGPGFPERGDRTRRSISAKHNTESKTSYSKSYTNSKKEELLKVINEAKQKLENGQRIRKNEVKKMNTIQEVGYRSNLRGSQSISDLSHSFNLDSSLRTNRTQKTGDHSANTKPNAWCSYFNCAAPKYVLTQNCNVMRQLQRNYPPYPYEVGIYSAPQSLQQNAGPSTSQQQQQTAQRTRPDTLELMIPSATDKGMEKDNSLKARKHSGILKNYKSCPVSPVHEELEWSNLPTDTNKIVFTEPKRHSVYSENAKSILDMIHTDTEKMIEEITKKYGDLDDYDPPSETETKPSIKPNPINVKEKPAYKKELNEHGILSEDNGNFSSDSLEDCSLDLDLNKSSRNVVKKKKSVCKKHHRKGEPLRGSNSLPKRSVSDYFIYEEFYQTRCTNVSLSDILNEDENKENRFLETQRHSSASFFLIQYPERKSQESILSDDFSGVSYYNSMESILSDELDCVSAPLEVLFNKNRKDSNKLSSTMDKYDGASKSYGSSPNGYNGFDFYMQNRYMERNQERDTSNYSIDNFYDGVKNAIDESKSPTKYNPFTPTTTVYPPAAAGPSSRDDIPRFSSRNAQYGASVNKSLSKEFATQRQQKNSNPLFCEFDESDFFVKKPVNPPPNLQPKPSLPCHEPESIFPVLPIRKSCSFEIEINNPSLHRSRAAAKRFEQNLEKFEKDQEASLSAKPGNLAIDYVPHKPPVPTRRSSSMRSRSKTRNKERYNTVGQINCPQIEKRSTNPFETRDYVNNELLSKKERSDEKSFEIFISEKESHDDDNLDSLELYTKPNLHNENSIDSLDELVDKNLKNSQNEKSHITEFSQVEYSKFKDIEKKINVINKLVEMEEKKLEQERIQKENRVKPFECDSSQKGYVKSLTMNFDKLAKAIDEEIEFNRTRLNTKIKRNYSLPDVLEGAKFQVFDFVSSDMTNDNDDDDDLGDTAESEKMKVDCSEKDKGNPKSLMSVQIDDSSIRRACSLSDLSMGKGPKTPVTSTFQKPSQPNRSSNIPTRSTPKKMSSTNSKSGSGMGTRSISVGVLNQSDSETDSFVTRGMRSNVTPQNRPGSNAGTPRHANKNAANVITRRKGLQNSYSSVNLSTTGQDDSSSEETQTPATNSGKPVVPPRPRNIGGDYKKYTINNTNNAKLRSSSADNVVDNVNADPTSQLCSNIINMLNTTTNAVLQLHTRLKYNEATPGTRNNNLMLKELENAVIMTQNMLTKITSNKTDNNPFVPVPNDQCSLENGDYFLMMNKCADILNKVRNKNKSSDCESET